MDPVPHPSCRDREHAPKLPTTQQANRRARRDHCFHDFQSEEKEPICTTIIQICSRVSVAPQLFVSRARHFSSRQGRAVELSLQWCLFIGTMLSEWEIKARSRHCARTQETFEDGATIFTLLFRERVGFRREDISEKAWQLVKDSVEPFSFWKSKFQAAPPPAPEA